MALWTGPVDWTAVAAVTAIVIWVADWFRRLRHRRATERFLAQIIITEFAAARIEAAKLRVAIVPPGRADLSRAPDLLRSRDVRQEIASYTSNIRVDLPSSALDKADVFRERTSNRMAWAISSIRRLKQAAGLMSDLEDPTGDQGEVEIAVMHFLKQMQDTEQAIQDAYEALLDVGRASWILRTGAPKK